MLFFVKKNSCQQNKQKAEAKIQLYSCDCHPTSTHTTHPKCPESQSASVPARGPGRQGEVESGETIPVYLVLLIVWTGGVVSGELQLGLDGNFKGKGKAKYCSKNKEVGKYSSCSRKNKGKFVCVYVCVC